MSKKGKPQTPQARARAQERHLRRMNPGVPVSIRLPSKQTDSCLISTAAVQNLLEGRATEDDFSEIEAYARYHRLLCGLFVIERHCPTEQLRDVSNITLAADHAVARVKQRFQATGALSADAEDRDAFDALLGLAPEMERAATRRQINGILRHVLYGDPLPHTKRTADGVVIVPVDEK